LQEMQRRKRMLQQQQMGGSYRDPYGSFGY
jgi:hypothetical protein